MWLIKSNESNKTNSWIFIRQQSGSVLVDATPIPAMSLGWAETGWN